jgi:hypothetical protein
MPEERKVENTQRDKVDRPEPHLDPVEGDLETIEEDLKQKEQQERSRGQGG